MKNKLRPCDCKDIFTAKKLNEQGIGNNGNSIIVEPNSVILTMEHTTIKIPMFLFKMFAEWYLEPQEIEGYIPENKEHSTATSILNHSTYGKF